VSIIKPMLKYYDTLTDRHDDERIGRYLMNNCIRSCYSIPCLVDHNDHTPGLAGNGDHNGRVSGLFIDDQKFTIPKMIHQLWIGPNPAPWKWMKTWREKNPGWLYRLWTEKEIKETKWVNQHLIDYYWSKKIWHGVKDVCQYEILHNHGGCFFDADAECLDSINGLFSDCYEGYSCYENEKVRNGLVSPLLAAPAGSKFAKELIDGLTNINIPSDDSPWKVTGNRYMGEMVKKTACNIKILPSHYFLPEHFTGEKYEGNDKIYSKHHWGTTLDSYAKGVI
jgi:mannosyltransferase OCH1-like enzyme